MAEDGQGPGLPEVEKIGYVGEVVDGIDSLAVASEGSDDDKKSDDADTPPTSKKDEGLAIVPFGPPPPTEECPVCFVPLPRHAPEVMHMICCGKTFCCACCHESERVLEVKNAKRAEKKLKPLAWLCPFCRAPKAKSEKELVRRYEKRAEKGDKNIIFLLSEHYFYGRYGLAKDLRTSSDLVRRAADLGDVAAIGELGRMYAFGVDGVSKDEKTGRELLEWAAKKGNDYALVFLAELEDSKERPKLARTYLRTAAAAGNDRAIERLWKRFRAGEICKDDLEKSLRAYQKANEDMRSEERERYKQWMKVQKEKEEKEQEGK